MKIKIKSIKILSVILFLIFYPTKLLFSEWTDLTTGINDLQQSVCTVNENCAWVCAIHGIVLKTTNSGLNWINVGTNPPLNSLPLGSIYAINENVAFTTAVDVNTQLSELFRTSDGGLNWAIVLSQPNGFIDHFMFKDSVNGFCLGDPVGGRWSLWKTSNQGLNWDSARLFLPDAGSEYSFSKDLEIQNDSIWFGTNNYKIYYSYDNGTHWNYIPVDCPVILTLTVSGSTGFAGELCAFKTTNSGNSWNGITLPFGDVILSFTHIDKEFWFAREDRIYYSSDNGKNFILQHISPNDTDVYRTINLKKVDNQIVGWAVRQWAGGISKYTEPIGIKPISSQIPNEYILFQNYPNPFNPSTLINYQLPVSNIVELVVYDVLGRKVATLVNEKQEPGKYQATWDASNFASGVYFYKLTVTAVAGSSTGDFTQIRKMVVLK